MALANVLEGTPDGADPRDIDRGLKEIDALLADLALAGTAQTVDNGVSTSDSTGGIALEIQPVNWFRDKIWPGLGNFALGQKGAVLRTGSRYLSMPPIFRG